MTKSCIDQDMIDDSIRILDLNQDDVSEKTIVNSFIDLLAELGGDKSGTEKVIAAKNTLLAAIIEDQLSERSRYYIKLPIPNACPNCRGKGFKPEFFYDVLVLPCKVCDGTGIARSICKRCKGKGNVGQKTCQTCKGKGIYEYRRTSKRRQPIKCKNCGGSGSKSKPVNTGKIKEIVMCKKCKGIGRKPLSVSTPVLSKDIAKKLTET